MRIYMNLGAVRSDCSRGEIVTADELTKLALNRGFDGIELNFMIREIPTLAPLLRRYEEIEISFHSHFPEFNLASLNRFIRNASLQQLREEILLCDRFGVSILTFHPGFQDKVLTRREAMDMFWKSLDQIYQDPIPSGVTLCLENMDGKSRKLCRSREEIAASLERFPDLRWTCDFAHLLMNGTDIHRFLDDLDERIAHCHISGWVEGRGHSDISLQESQVDLSPYIARFRDRDIAFVIENNSWPLLMASKGQLESWRSARKP